MAQSFIVCPLDDLAVLNPAGDASDPVIVGGPGALTVDDGDTSYLEVTAQPGADSGAIVVGTFAPAAVPAGHVVTGVLLAVNLRESGSLGAPNVLGGHWDGAHHATRGDAQSAGWLWGDDFWNPYDGTTYAWVSPDSDDLPQYGYLSITDAGWWTEVQQAGQEHYTLANLAAGTIKGYVRAPTFYGGSAASFQSRITYLALVIRHAPAPTGPVSDWVQIPDLPDVAGSDGEKAETLTTENTDVAPLGDPWDQGAVDANYATIVHATAPDDTFTPVTGIAGGTGNEAYVFMSGNWVPQRVNYQNRMSIYAHQPYPIHRYINGSAFGQEHFFHQLRSFGALDYDHAGLVDTGSPEWQSWRIAVEKFEVQLYADTGTSGGDPGHDVVPEVRVFDERTLPAGVDYEAWSTDDWPGIDPAVNATWYRQTFASFPSVSGADLNTAPLPTGLGGPNSDDHLALIWTDTIPTGDTSSHVSDWIDVTDRMYLDDHGVETVLVHVNLAQQRSPANPADLPPGYAGMWEYYQAVGVTVRGRYTLRWPLVRFPTLDLAPIFQDAGQAWIRQRQVGVLAQRRQATGHGLAQRQPRWR